MSSVGGGLADPAAPAAAGTAVAVAVAVAAARVPPGKAARRYHR
jgi:hypothetical protein